MGEDNGIGCYRRFLAGDKEGLEELVALYQRALIAFIDGYVRDKALAEDVEIDVFFELYKRKKPFDERGASFKTYLFTIARNKALNAVKQRSRRRECPLKAAEARGAKEDAESALLGKERAASVHSALEKLPEEYRETLYLSISRSCPPTRSPPSRAGGRNRCITFWRGAGLR